MPAPHVRAPALRSTSDVTDAPGIDLLPHAPPFRFVDEVIACDPGRSVTARWHITGEEPWLAGHFPGHPIVPGVLQVEALAQAGALALLASPTAPGRLPVLGGVEAVRFRHQVVPGDVVDLEVTIDRIGARGGWGVGRATVDDRLTCTARLLVVVVDRPSTLGPGGGGHDDGGR